MSAQTYDVTVNYAKYTLSINGLNYPVSTASRGCNSFLLLTDTPSSYSWQGFGGQ